jgi:hypothetical protein
MIIIVAAIIIIKQEILRRERFLPIKIQSGSSTSYKSALNDELASLISLNESESVGSLKTKLIPYSSVPASAIAIFPISYRPKAGSFFESFPAVFST